MNNLLHDIPLPSPGRSVRFWCLGDAISMSMPKIPQELPLFDYDLLQFFAILGVENAIKLWVCLLLENQILVYSSDFDKVNTNVVKICTFKRQEEILNKELLQFLRILII